jgi:3-hydroxyisobutyrate dehydrogenase-like beta-hydroxyacid dehydrogenase
VTAIGIVGLGEAGAAIALELLKVGHAVSCLDKRIGQRTARRAKELGIACHDSAAEFASAVAAVVIAVPGSAALDVAVDVVPHLGRDRVYADCSAKTPKTRDAIAKMCGAADVRFADVSLMDTVRWADRSVEVLMSGDGARVMSSLLAGTRLNVSVIDEVRPMSAEVKLARSMFTKGLAALLLETFALSRRAGALDVVEPSIRKFMREDFDRIVQLLVGTALRHGQRRSDEMADAVTFARALGGRAPITCATADLLAEVADLAHGEPETDPDEARAVIEWLVERGFLGAERSAPPS